MATFRKRGKTWRAEVRRKNIPPQSATFDTKAEAVAWAHEIEAGVRKGVAGVHTLAEAIERYRRDVAPNRGGARWEDLRLARIARDWTPARKRLADLTAADFAAWRDARLQEVAPATVGREMTIVRGVLEVARKEWGWIATQPMAEVRAPREPPPRRRRMTQDEIKRVCMALGYRAGQAPQRASQRVALAFLFAIETAMRSGEIVGMHWADVHPRYVVLPRTKNGDRREVPLSAAAREILALLPRGAGPVFGLTSAVRDVLFREARDAAAIKNLRFHDSRAEAVWRLSKKLDVLQLARMVGHRDLRSLQIYYNESADELSKRLDAFEDAQRPQRGRPRPRP